MVSNLVLYGLKSKFVGAKPFGAEPKKIKDLKGLKIRHTWTWYESKPKRVAVIKLKNDI